MKNKISSVLMIMALALVQAPSSFAALLYDNYSPDIALELVPTMLATDFNVGSQPLTVTKLGVWSTGPYTYADWKVGIWEISNQPDPEPLVNAEILVTSDHWVNPDEPNSAWLFADVAPTVLTANTTYRIGAFPKTLYFTGTLAYPLGGSFTLGPGISSAPQGSFGLQIGQGGFNYPTQFYGNPMLIANAEFLAPPVPEPSSALLLAIGLAGVWFVRRPGMTSRRPSSLF